MVPLAAGAAGGPKQGKRPDMILVVADDPDFRDTLPNMPHTRTWLCDRGVEFTQTFTDFSLCSPGRATLLTGQTAAHHGVIGENPDRGTWTFFAPQADSTILTWAKAAGYRVGMFGHLMNEYVETSRVPPGLDDCAIFCSANAPFKYFGPKTMAVDGAVTQWRNKVYTTTLIQQLACDFITATAADQPLLLVVLPLCAHGSAADPNSPSPDPAYLHAYDDVAVPHYPNLNGKVRDKPDASVGLLPKLRAADIAGLDHEWRMTRAALRSVDDMNLAIINTMRSQGRWTKAHMAFTGDNGLSLGAHRWRGKAHVDDDSNRVPLCWRGPITPSTGQARLEMISNVDVVATMVDVMGLAPDRELDGASLVPLLRGDTPAWRDAVIVRNNVTWGIRTADGWMYAESDTPDFGHEVELYDMAGQIAGAPDPWQNKNVAGRPAFAEKQADLAARLAAARA